MVGSETARAGPGSRRVAARWPAPATAVDGRRRPSAARRPAANRRLSPSAPSGGVEFGSCRQEFSIRSSTSRRQRAVILIRLARSHLGRLDSQPDRGVAADGLVVCRPACQLSPEPVVVGVTGAVPPSPGAVDAQPKYLAESVEVVHEQRLVLWVGDAGGPASKAGSCQHRAAGTRRRRPVPRCDRAARPRYDGSRSGRDGTGASVRVVLRGSARFRSLGGSVPRCGRRQSVNSS